MSLLSIAQTRPIAGNLEANLKSHCQLISLASANGASLIIFPELSLTGYEPALAASLATHLNHDQFEPLQALSNLHNITICTGMPFKAQTETKIAIGMFILTPQAARQLYCKQHLHPDELPYFTPGSQDLLIALGDCKVAPAICYESLLPEHSAQAKSRGANIYAASVAKPQRNLEKAVLHYPQVAKTHSMTVLMANSVGPCDNFISAGHSSVWSDDGTLLAQLDGVSESILLFDSQTGHTEKIYF